MVSVNPNDGSVGTAYQTHTDRGLVHEPERVEQRPYIAQGSFVSWGAVIAGSLAAVSILILSSSLAYACGIPAFSGGTYGWGAGVWSVVTAAIAFFIGGGIVSYFTPRSLLRTGTLHGAMCWALSLPLILLLSTSALGLIRGFIAADMLHMTVQPPTAQPANGALTGAAWGAFISIAVGLIAACVGGASGMGARSDNVTAKM